MNRSIPIAAEKATQIALDVIQLLGGNGYINGYPRGRLLRDEIGAGTSEIRARRDPRPRCACRRSSACAAGSLPIRTLVAITPPSRGG